jgi:branched-chain amino acid transport system ATP-binding protein
MRRSLCADLEETALHKHLDRNVTAVLDITHLSKSFGGLRAFNEISFQVEPGEIVGLIGPNGAGKTTVINCITGVYQPNAGAITFNGVSLLNLRPHQICRAGIGRTFQIPRPFMNMTVLDNLRVCSHGRDIDHRGLLGMVGLWDKRDLKAKAISFHERRLLELSRALAVKPSLLLLDETMAGLNPSETLAMMALLRRIHRDLGISILWIEHVMQAIMETAHRVLVLHQGRLIAQGSPRSIANNPEVIEAYLGEEYSFAVEKIECS